MAVALTPATAAGPYHTRDEALAALMPAEVQRAGEGGAPEQIRRTIAYAALANACIGAGVELGEYDAKVLGLLCTTSDRGSIAQVVIGLVSRAYAAGLRDGGA